MRAKSRCSLVLVLIVCSVWEETPSRSYLEMKAFFWQKIRATWGQEVECRASSAICSALWFQLFSRFQQHLDCKMELFFNPFDNLLCILLGISFTVWFTLLLVFIIVPAIFGVSFGIRRLYMKTLLKIFEVRAYAITVCLFQFTSWNEEVP